MGTKANPGRFDCYAKAGPREQIFTLLDRDPLAPFLVSIWSSMRYGDFEAARAKFEAMLDHVGSQYAASPDADKASEALDCAMAMFAAQRNRENGSPSQLMQEVAAAMVMFATQRNHENGSPTQLMQCSGCRYVTDDRRAVTCCGNHCYDNTGQSCDSWPCPSCERHHFWCGSISPEDVAKFREGRQR